MDNNPVQLASAPYRTVRAEPLRDTEAAQQANQEGLKLLARNDLDGAAEAFKQALVADLEFGPAHNNLGRVYYRQKNMLYEAANEFDCAAKLMPTNAEPHNNLGMVWEAKPVLDKAIDEYRKAVGLSDNIEYRANLVRAFIRRGDRTEEVRQLLEQVIAKDLRPDWQHWAQRQLATFREKS